MARKNPIIENLKEELRIAKRERENEKELKLRAQGKLEKYEEAEEEDKRRVRDMMRRDEEYRHQLEDQVVWLRRLVENLCIPEDKLKMIEKARQDIVISGNGGGFPGRNY